MVEAREYQPHQRIIFSDIWGASSVAAISRWEASSKLRHRNYLQRSVVINDSGKIGSEDFRVFQQNRPEADLHIVDERLGASVLRIFSRRPLVEQARLPRFILRRKARTLVALLGSPYGLRPIDRFHRFCLRVTHSFAADRKQM